MKKHVIGLAGLAAVGLALAGCATGGAPAGGSTALDPDAKLDGEITVWSWDVGAVALERLAAAFEKEHEGTTVNVVDVGYDNAYDKMSVGFQAGTGLPDVVTIETDAAPGYITQFPKGMLDLNPILGEDEADFDPFKWAAGSDAEGSLRIAPWDSGTVAMFYRTDIVEEAGVDLESVQTWDDLIAAGKVIKEKTGHTLMSTDIAAGAGFQARLQQIVLDGHAAQDFAIGERPAVFPIVGWRQHVADFHAALGPHDHPAMARIANRVDRRKAADLAHGPDAN